jgi:hypothetical protein
MQDAVKRVATALSGSGAFTLTAAWITYAAGDELSGRHTHADAAVVLLVLGLLLAGNGLAAFVWHRELVQAAGRQHRDGRTAPGVDWFAGD